MVSSRSVFCQFHISLFAPGVCLVWRSCGVFPMCSIHLEVTPRGTIILLPRGILLPDFVRLVVRRKMFCCDFHLLTDFSRNIPSVTTKSSYVLTRSLFLFFREDCDRSSIFFEYIQDSSKIDVECSSVASSLPCL